MTKKKTLVRLRLTHISTQPAFHESEVSDHRDGNPAGEAALKCTSAKTWKTSAQPGSVRSVHGHQESARSSASSADLRQRESFTDNVCAESRSRLWRAGVRAPSAEFNRTRIPAFCAHACASALRKTTSAHGQVLRENPGRNELGGGGAVL